jgi:hypothetical protein
MIRANFMKRLLTLLCILVFTIAKTDKSDSLSKRLKESLVDTERVNTLNCLCYEKASGNTDEGFKYCKNALALAKAYRCEGLVK